MRPFLILAILSLSLVTCNNNNKDKIIINNSRFTDCPEMYDQRSKPYSNLYQGTLNSGCLFSPDIVYLDKFCYSDPCVNPNNEYEFCYLRKENGMQSGDDLDLFKFNFCIGESNLITKHVAYSPDWSVNDWIIFTGLNRELWKVKSNGDSLTQLTFLGPYQSRAVWSNNGSKYIWNGKYIADKNGKLIQTINQFLNSYSWLNDSTLICGIENSFSNMFDIIKLDINTGIQYTIYSESYSGFANIYKYNSKSKDVYFVIDKNGLQKYGSVNLEKLTINVLDTFDHSIRLSGFKEIQNDRIIYQQILSDTMTGNPCILNYRSHISIMNNDGSNIRQILIPY